MESFWPDTAMRSEESGGDVVVDVLALSSSLCCSAWTILIKGTLKQANEQKLSVGMVKLCSSQGCLRCEMLSSIGSVVDMLCSSSSENAHTLILLSRP